MSGTTGKKSAETKKDGSVKKSSSAASKASAQKAKADRSEYRSQPTDEIFALDIGTRTVVGVLGRMENDVFRVISSYSVPHTQRAMIDGQIEDIKEVARVVNHVKKYLEDKNKVILSRVAIAAAGRALKTKRACMEFDLEDKDAVTEEAVKSFEVETVLHAQDELDRDVKNESMIFYCVGHTVVNYYLDEYKIKTLVGHKGRKAKVELIAAFLPGAVVESLYSVMDINELEVVSMTLEPIAAMNVIIPPEVRLINIALVDIGAGTSDIAVSNNGSIVAYAMSTVAGDEITEEIIKSYIVDFKTAEDMKTSGYKDEISYRDILGFDHTIKTSEFFSSLFPAVGSLAENIAENIIKANGQPPAAVFLVGGGSLIPELSGLVAEKLDIPANRVAIGGRNAMKNVSLGRMKINGPEYVTPIGIGVTATMNKGYDFSVVTLNGKKMRIFDTRTVTVINLLMLAGFKTTQVIGHSGRSLTFTLNGEKQVLNGEASTPSQITMNGMPVTLDTGVRQGDSIEFIPAVSGMNASVKLSDIAGDVAVKTVMVDGVKYPFGVIAKINEKLSGSDYQIRNFDDVVISEVDTLGDLMHTLPYDADKLSFYKSGKLLSIDYYLRENDDIVTGEKVVTKNSKAGELAKAVAEKNSIAYSYESLNATQLPQQTAGNSAEPDEAQPDFRVVLNGKSITLKTDPKNPVHDFIELMAIADIDIDNPPPSANMITTINGKNANFMDRLSYGDSIVIKWADE